MYQLEVIELKRTYGEIVSLQTLNGVLKFYDINGFVSNDCGHTMAIKSIEMKIKYFGSNKKILHDEKIIVSMVKKLANTTFKNKQYIILKDMMLTLDYQEIENVFNILRG